MNEFKRKNGRALDCVRPLKASYDVFGYSQSSILFEVGDTKVLCSISLQNKVPPFLRGQNSGWLTAEYAMLPTATQQRVNRESSSVKRSGRSVEISRLIGRVLRSAIDLNKLGERTIHIDCDVLQADGGTRTACITGAFMALERVINAWDEQGMIEESIIKERVAAISVGVCNGVGLLDLDYKEDSTIDADFNFIMTQSGNIIEIQGTAEDAPISWNSFGKMKDLAVTGVEQIFSFFDTCNDDNTFKVIPVKKERRQQKMPLFSLQNRR